MQILREVPEGSGEDTCLRPPEGSCAFSEGYGADAL